MSGQKQVLVYIGSKTCPACIAFTNTWEQLTRDTELTSSLNLQAKIFPTNAPTKEFDFISGFPAIVICPAQYYTTKQMGRYSKPFTGSSRTFENVKNWALASVPRQVPVQTQSSRAGPSYRPTTTGGFNW